MKKILYIMMFTVISFLSMSWMTPSSSDNSMYGAEKEVKELVAGERLKLDYNYAKDDKYIYYMDKIIEGADVESFVILAKESFGGEDDNTYAKDKYRIYFAGKPIEGVDLSSFEVFDNRIARDKFNVYNLDKKLKNIDIETFEYIGEGCPSDIGDGKLGACICFYTEASKYKDKNGEYITGEYTTEGESWIEQFKLNID